LVYGLWAATPGTHASPFEWSMTQPACVSWLAITILYLGAFLTGVRPGRWHASRLFPLIAAVIATLLTAMAAHAFNIAPWLGALTVIVDLWIIGVILYVAQTRDYS
jgi:hypothetical protein